MRLAKKQKEQRLLYQQIGSRSQHIYASTYWAYSGSLPRFRLSNIAKINFLFSSRYCKNNKKGQEIKKTFRTKPRNFNITSEIQKCDIYHMQVKKIQCGRSLYSVYRDTKTIVGKTHMSLHDHMTVMINKASKSEIYFRGLTREIS